MIQPDPSEIRARRMAAQWTQRESAAAVHITLRGWQRYEAPVGAKNYTPIPEATRQLFWAKTAKRIKAVRDAG